MPTILRSGPYRFFFYSSDGHELPHVHVVRDDAVAKFWMNPIRLDHSQGFQPPELRRVRSTIQAQQPAMLKAWHEYFAH